jgi:membrane protease YdiL (CAAX protease family)
VAVRVGGCTARELGLDRRDAGRGLAEGLVAAAALAIVLAVAAILPATRGLFQDRRAEDASVVVLLYLVLVRVPLGTVTVEETLFRGVLLGLGLRRWSRRVAVAVSSVAFGLWHILPARQLTTFNPVTEGLAGDPAGRALGVAAAMARHGPGRPGPVLAAATLRQPAGPRPAALDPQRPRLHPRLRRPAGRLTEAAKELLDSTRGVHPRTR